jgi:hypothetical protein
MSPLNVVICTTISYTLWVEWYYLKNNYLTLRSKVKVPRRSLWYATHRLMVMHPHTKYHWPISKDKNVMARTRKYYLKNNYLTLRSKSHEGHHGTRHPPLWSCTHIPNIIDLSGKTKKLWSGQASLRRSRRSGRKNQTKTICLPSFEGKISLFYYSMYTDRMVKYNTIEKIFWPLYFLQDFVSLLPSSIRQTG